MSTIAVDAPASHRFGRAWRDGSRRRLQAMRRAYRAGVAVVALGLLAGVPVLLAIGAALVNLGTVLRYLVVALDVDAADTPLLPGR